MKVDIITKSSFQLVAVGESETWRFLKDSNSISGNCNWWRDASSQAIKHAIPLWWFILYGKCCAARICWRTAHVRVETWPIDGWKTWLIQQLDILVPPYPTIMLKCPNTPPNYPANAWYDVSGRAPYFVGHYTGISDKIRGPSTILSLCPTGCPVRSVRAPIIRASPQGPIHFRIIPDSHSRSCIMTEAAIRGVNREWKSHFPPVVHPLAA